eukprot:4004713-Alexandrium_andersonii.AAC.1
MASLGPAHRALMGALSGAAPAAREFHALVVMPSCCPVYCSRWALPTSHTMGTQRNSVASCPPPAAGGCSLRI